MDIELLLDHPAPRAGSPLTLRALVRVSGRAPDDTRRRPLNLAMVLDRSGSMAGPKLEHARDAAALLVRRIWPEDTVGVVAFCSEVITLAAGATGDAHGTAEARIREIQTGGMTNLSGGWLRGRELVQEAFREEGVNRIVLMTDGLANQGITDRTALEGLCRSARAEGISTTTIGFGEGFDEDLLRAMADAGGGATYYIEDPDQAPGIFEEEVEGLLSLAAQNVTIQMDPGPGALLSAVRHSYPTTPVGNGLRLDVGDLYAREPRLALMEFRLEGAEPGSELEVATITVQGYVLTDEGGVEQRTVDLPVRLRVGDGPRVEPEVRRVVALLDAADARERAVRQREQGDWDNARLTLDEAADRLQRELPDDSEAQREARGLRDIADRMREGHYSISEAKYLKQQAYDLGRSRSLARERYRRE